jgi:hypothetical protein
MLDRISIAGLALAALLGASVTAAQAWDDTKYPDLKGQWVRGYPGGSRFDPSKGIGPRQEAPLTPEYQAIYKIQLEDQAKGNQGIDPTIRCISPGMPRIMHVYSPMQIVVTPETTHVLIEHIHDNRRIYTDGRDWPEDMYDNPQYAGYSIGKWVDEDGDGKYDVLEVETRFLKLPRSYDIAGIPFHSDGQTVIKERIYIDNADPNVLYDQITMLDHALTRPYVKLQKAIRNPKARPVWFSDVCSENIAHVRIENENYFKGADGKLMPSKKDQAPPDLKYFTRRTLNR